MLVRPGIEPGPSALKTALNQLSKPAAACRNVNSFNNTSSFTKLIFHFLPMRLSQSVTLMVLMLRFNAKLQLDTVGAQIFWGRKLAVHWHVENQLAVALKVII